MDNIIVDFTGKKQVLKGCLGCECASGNLVAGVGVLYKNKNLYVLQDFELPIDGFIIISPNRHVEKFTELSQEEQVDIFSVANKILHILESNGVAEEYNLILEEKQGIHLHLWLMPRHKWMIEKYGNVIKNIKAIQEYSLQNLRTKENINKVLQTCELIKKEMNK